MYPLFETIKVFERQFYNLKYHNQRLNFSRKVLFGSKEYLDLGNILTIPDFVDESLFKCRVGYGRQGVEQVEFFSYEMKLIHSLKIVYDDDINYSFKYTDRNDLENLLLKKEKCDDILIIKNGFVTDASICNIAFFDGNRWLTPSTPLLKGTRRANLLEKGQIYEEEVRVTDLKTFKKAALINAFRDLGGNKIQMRNIKR
jgi:4-amino-4-deoxychorismate lyase